MERQRRPRCLGGPHRPGDGALLTAGATPDRPTSGTLAGLRIGVTGARKGAELCSSLERRGATTILGPTIEADQPAPDDELLPQIDALLASPPAFYVANTGLGSRLLAEVADRNGRGDALRAVLGDTRCVARGAKAVGGLRSALGIRPEHVSADETDASVAGYLIEVLQPGDHLAIQHSGRTSPVYEALRDHGVTMHTLHPYRTGIPTDDAPARALIAAAVAGELDVVVCTSAIAVDHLIAIAEAAGQRDALVTTLQGPVIAASIGSVTSDAYAAHNVPARLVPTRHRTGDLIRHLESWHATRPA